MKLLIVDNSPIFVEGLKNLLNAEGMEDIEVVSSGAAAIKRIRISVPDIVLMDTRMKPMSGFETTRCMRLERPKMKIILLSESGSDSELCESVMCGATGFLRKDIDANTLLDMLKKL